MHHSHKIIFDFPLLNHFIMNHWTCVICLFILVTWLTTLYIHIGKLFVCIRDYLNGQVKPIYWKLIKEMGSTATQGHWLRNLKLKGITAVHTQYTSLRFSAEIFRSLKIHLLDMLCYGILGYFKFKSGQ